MTTRARNVHPAHSRVVVDPRSIPPDMMAAARRRVDALARGSSARPTRDALTDGLVRLAVDNAHDVEALIGCRGEAERQRVAQKYGGSRGVRLDDYLPRPRRLDADDNVAMARARRHARRGLVRVGADAAEGELVEVMIAGEPFLCPKPVAAELQRLSAQVEAEEAERRAAQHVPPAVDDERDAIADARAARKSRRAGR